MIETAVVFRVPEGDEFVYYKNYDPLALLHKTDMKTGAVNALTLMTTHNASDRHDVPITQVKSLKGLAASHSHFWDYFNQNRDFAPVKGYFVDMKKEAKPTLDEFDFLVKFIPKVS